MTRVLLASRSPARLTTLRRAGIEPVVRVSDVDEDAVLAEAERLVGERPTPADAALRLARAKAETVAEQAFGDVIVLGCDSVLELDGVIHGKPSDEAQAIRLWQAMRGRSGVLHTGHWLIDIRGGDATERSLGETASTVVHFADATDAEIEAYVGTGEPLQVAGAFTVDGLGGPFITGIDGDHHNVVGLSLPLLRRLLTRLGVSITDLWRA